MTFSVSAKERILAPLPYPTKIVYCAFSDKGQRLGENYQTKVIETSAKRYIRGR
jgi:hypothetical protein